MGSQERSSLLVAIACLAPLWIGADCAPPPGARFSAETGILSVSGSAEADTFVVSRTGTAAIVVNGGLTPIQGGVPTVANTLRIEINGRAGDDHLALDESQGPLPAARLWGGPGADVLLGGSGDDVLDGGAGDDTLEPGRGSDVVLGGDGADALVWRSGDGADSFDGGPQVDFLRVVGSDVAADDFLVSAGPNALLELRDLGAGVRIEALAADRLVLEARGGDDRIEIENLGEPMPVQEIHVDAGAGHDQVDAEQLADVSLVVLAGLGDDLIQGSTGNDEVHGGDGNDVAFLGAGDDVFVWNPGDDLDTVEGQDGFDTLLFHGSGANENVDVSANGGRVRFFRNVATVTTDLDGVEAIDFAARGGTDVVVVNDVSGTDLVEVNLELAAATGGGDAAPDTVVVQGTELDDVVVVVGDAGGASVLGLAAQVNLTNAESALDRLTIHARGGDDAVDASGLSASAIQLTADGGTGHDVLMGGDGNDVLLGGEGDDVLIGGPGLDVLDGGLGDNIVIQ